MIRVENLSFAYGGVEVFHGIDFTVGEGQILSLVGPNGAGKTTLLKCLNRLLEPSSGIVAVAGKGVKTLSRLELARTVAYVPQASLAIFPMTVFDAIMLGRKPYLNWSPRKRDFDMVSNIIDQLELTDMAMRDINQMSGGERQKVAIARAIVQEPKILLFDEPTTYLDLKYQLRIMQFIRDIVREQNICSVITTHDLNLALQFSDRLAVLKDGALVAEGDTAIMTEDLILDVYGVEARLLPNDDKLYMAPVRAVDGHSHEHVHIHSHPHIHEGEHDHH
ncbi:MAG: ATP-binding cassette domain-containing protein [Clostridiales Family XIII bacterium]|jgi:iron complex transport system ATP-binding protein|nr:ATP-binding cassette domain-containing protein [Clostridiales Family XIII bacterium]